MSGVAILTVSDSCAAGAAEDRSGPALAEFAKARGWDVVERRVVADRRGEIARVVREWTDRRGFELIVTTGGTGLAARDVTPESVAPLLDKKLDGWAELMRAAGLKKTPLAPLSRQLAGSRGASLIVCVPGSPKGAVESLEAVAHLVPHALRLLRGETAHAAPAAAPEPAADHACCGREEPGLLPLDEARARVLAAVSPLGAEDVALKKAHGRWLARDVAAAADLPGFDNSLMDGFAVAAADVKAAPVELKLVATVRAGQARPPRLRPGEAARIMTGAPLPGGADAVVMQEKARLSGTVVTVLEPAAARANVRERGEDLTCGETLLARGTRLRAWEIAALAAQGMAQAPVFRSPRVALLSTGDELRGPGKKLRPGQIHDSSLPAAEALLRARGFKTTAYPRLPDRLDALEAGLRKAAAGSDAVVVFGGVSVGDFDYTAAALDALGFKKAFWKIALKPGKPALFGTLTRGARVLPVFGLPGNPLSSLVCLEELALPAFEKMRGAADLAERFPLRGVAANDFSLPAGRRQAAFARARRDGAGWSVELIRPQASHRVATACRANALALTAPGPGTLSRGDDVVFRWLD